MHSQDPLILTLQLDEESLSFFDKQRQEYFPKERNYLKAHLTLFHHLPPQEYASIVDVLQQKCRHKQPFALEVTEVKLLGRGVGYKIESAVLQKLHSELQQRWQLWLTPQDRQKLWPHITVQNKVTPAQAKELHAQLQEKFKPISAKAIGVQLWAYKGGPWELLQEIPFTC